MRYKDAKKEDLPKEVHAAMKTALEEDKGLFIFGDTGTGKTYTLHAIANNRNERVDNFVDLLSTFRDSIVQGWYHDKLIEYANKERIYIDDMGAEKMSDFVHEFVYSLLNKRYERMKRTVISTNLTLDDFKKRYGDRILSRIMEMCVLIELGGEDRRLG